MAALRQGGQGELRAKRRTRSIRVYRAQLPGQLSARQIRWGREACCDGSANPGPTAQRNVVGYDTDQCTLGSAGFGKLPEIPAGHERLLKVPLRALDWTAPATAAV